MGDRGNVVLNYGNDQKVYLYTHWERYMIGTNLQDAFKRGRTRWEDPSYMARIIFCDLIGEDTDSLTGFGIDVQLGDGDETAEVDFENLTVRYKDRAPVSFGEFVTLDLEEDE